ncbi:MAG: hypothetical protein MJ014_04785 [Methanocorpusculum sp.]|nr:hypothetical protein [Methanocorpusculum sp.]
MRIERAEFFLSARMELAAGRKFLEIGSPSVISSVTNPKCLVGSFPGTGVQPEYLSRKGAFSLRTVFRIRWAAGTMRAMAPALTRVERASDGKIHAANGVTGTVAARSIMAFASARPSISSFANSHIMAQTIREIARMLDCECSRFLKLPVPEVQDCNAADTCGGIPGDG